MTQITKEAIEAGLRITLSSVNMPAGECLHETDVREILSAALPFLSSPGKDGGQEVEAVVIGDDTIVRLMRDNLPAKVVDELTFERHPPLFPQATYDVPTYGMECFVKAILASRPQPASPALVEAATAVLASWDERMGGEREEIRTYDRGGMNHDYWSPATSLVDSEAISKLRSALSSSSTSREGER